MLVYLLFTVTSINRKLYRVWRGYYSYNTEQGLKDLNKGCID